MWDKCQVQNPNINYSGTVTIIISSSTTATFSFSFFKSEKRKWFKKKLKLKVIGWLAMALFSVWVLWFRILSSALSACCMQGQTYRNVVCNLSSTISGHSKTNSWHLVLRFWHYKSYWPVISPDIFQANVTPTKYIETGETFIDLSTTTTSTRALLLVPANTLFPSPSSAHTHTHTHTHTNTYSHIAQMRIYTHIHWDHALSLSLCWD